MPPHRPAARFASALLAAALAWAGPLAADTGAAGKEDCKDKPALPDAPFGFEALATAGLPLVISGPQRSNAVAPGLLLRLTGPLAQKRQRFIIGVFAERVFSSDPRSTTLGLDLGLGWVPLPGLRLEGLLEGGSRRVATVCDPVTDGPCPGAGWLAFGGGRAGAAWATETRGLSFTAALHVQVRFEFDGCFGPDPSACINVPGGRAFALQASAGIAFH